jgi:site-specific DNA recombinase
VSRRQAAPGPDAHGERSATGRSRIDQNEAQRTGVAAYVRVSTDEQKRSGLGLEAQLRKVQAMAAVKDWEEPTVYRDEGISGTKGPTKRPGLAQLLRDVRSGRYAAVIIPSLDRLGRKTRLVLELVEELSAAGVALVSCKESLDTATPQGQFVLTLFAALAQLERDMIAQRTTAALDAKRRRDGFAGGRLPYGYHRLTDGGIGVHREQAPVVRYIFRLRAGGMSYRRIAAHLSIMTAAPRGGDVWRHSAVAEILSNEAIYAGGRRGEGELRWPAILREGEGV